MPLQAPPSLPSAASPHFDTQSLSAYWPAPGLLSSSPHAAHPLHSTHPQPPPALVAHSPVDVPVWLHLLLHFPMSSLAALLLPMPLSQPLASPQPGCAWWPPPVAALLHVQPLPLLPWLAPSDVLRSRYTLPTVLPSPLTCPSPLPVHKSVVPARSGVWQVNRLIVSRSLQWLAAFHSWQPSEPS